MSRRKSSGMSAKTCWATSETEVAAAGVAWLRAAGWEVYQEVEGPHGRAIDIVAVKDGALWAIEAKRALTLAVFEQAHSSTPYTHRASVLVPRMAKVSDGYDFGVLVARRFGIGLIEVWPPGATPRVVEAVAPAHRAEVKGALAASLRPAQQVYAAAGSSGSSHWTPFRETATKLKALVWASRATGISMGDAVARLQHHYGSNETAVVELRRCIEAGIIDGIRVQRVNGKKVLLYPKLVSGRKPLTVAEEAALAIQERARHTAHAKKR